MFRKYQQKFKQIPRRAWIIGASSLAVLTYGLLFFIPKPVEFSYAGTTCIGQFFLFPDIQKQNGGDGLALSLEGVVSVGPVHLYSTKACIAPQRGFTTGSHALSVSPWGGPLFAKQYRVNVAEAPGVVANAITPKQAISVVRPLEINLTGEDTIYSYTVLAAQEAADTTHTAQCHVKDGQARLSCDTAGLELDHDQAYALELKRDIPGITTSQSVAKFDVTTLAPVRITESTVTSDQTVFDAPSAAILTADMPIDGAEATLVRKDGEASVPVPVKVAVDGTKATVHFNEALARKSQYILTVTQLDGTNGASLAEPYVVSFSTSGGPKVSSVSSAAAGISRSERIIVTFDQPVDDSVDITKVAHATGAGVTVVKLSPTQVAYTLQNAPLCVAVTLSLDKGIKSGSNGTLSDEAWQFSTRVICGTSAVIGYSVKGRAIVAYYFGSGATTILFTGGMHGSEPSGQATMQAWANYLMTNGNSIPADKRVVIIPNTNPDGITAGSRNSSTNVNIGRNFPTANWKADIETTSGTLQNGGGTSAGSEPETAALMALTRQLRPRLEVSFHAQGRLVGANKYSDSVAVGSLYASTVGYQTMFYDAEAVMGYPMTGEYEDWMGEEMGISAILIELPSSSGNYLNSQLTALMKMLSV